MDLIERLYRIAGALLSGLTGPAFWTISSSGRVVGSLTYEAGTWCLTDWPISDHAS